MGCDRRCSFCATQLARGASRSRPIEELVEEANILAEHHPEIVLTGIRIGHYGRDFHPRGKEQLSALVATLCERTTDVRFRLGSIEATEIDDPMIDLLEHAGDRVAAHLHVPMQSGSNRILRLMSRWHTREDYRDRLLEICERLPTLGLGADVIVGFPGETEEDFSDTVDLVDSLPFSYLHVFPFSLRSASTNLPILDGLSKLFNTPP